jgi:hypothetical protein
LDSLVFFVKIILIQEVEENLGTTADSSDSNTVPAGSTETSSSALGGSLFGKLPGPLLEGLAATAPASPQRVASNIRGYFANKFEAAIVDTGKSRVTIAFLIHQSFPGNAKFHVGTSEAQNREKRCIPY